MTPVDALAVVAAGLAAMTALAAAREWLRAWPTALSWLEEALAPLLRAGSEGYEPSDAERRRLWLIGSVGLGAVLVIAVGPGVYLVMLAAVPLLSDRIVVARQRRYRARFDAGLGSWARALGDALNSGQSVRASLAGSTRAASPALEPELARLSADLEAGTPLESALEGAVRRVGSPQLGSIVAALTVAARSGGEAGELLRTLARACDERSAVVADARSATTQARMTGLAVAAMPLAAMLFAELAAPGFTSTMLNDEIARGLLIVSLAMQAAGFAVIRRISRVDE